VGVWAKTVIKPGQEDTRLMQRVVAGDDEALAELYDRYAARVFGVCVRILNEAQMAEDALQEVYVRVWERAHMFDAGRGNFVTWLMGITRNTCIDQLRRLRARPQAAEPPDEIDGFTFEESLTDPAGDVPEAAALNERAALVRRALQALTPEQRQVIELSYFRGLTRREIARKLNWPEGTVHTRARLALQTLRLELHQLGLRPEDL
jgi:RNA polymerase sigma-70 factor (ECF subfamily)